MLGAILIIFLLLEVSKFAAIAQMSGRELVPFNNSTGAGTQDEDDLTIPVAVEVPLIEVPVAEPATFVFANVVEPAVPIVEPAVPMLDLNLLNTLNYSRTNSELEMRLLRLFEEHKSCLLHNTLLDGETIEDMLGKLRREGDDYQVTWLIYRSYIIYGLKIVSFYMLQSPETPLVFIFMKSFVLLVEFAQNCPYLSSEITTLEHARYLWTAVRSLMRTHDVFNQLLTDPPGFAAEVERLYNLEFEKLAALERRRNPK